MLSACGTSTVSVGGPTPPPRVATLTPEFRPTAAPSATVASPTNHRLGAADAPLTIIMYGDFSCDLCLSIARSLAILRAENPGQISLVYRHFPQEADNVNALLAAQASEAADQQGKFWDMHDQLYAHAPEWRGLPPEQFRAKLTEYARTVGLDGAAFKAALDSQSTLPIIKQSIQAALAEGLKGVPALLFNGQAYSGRVDLWALQNYANLKLLEARWYKVPPALQIDPKKRYTATLTTEKGTVIINLFADAAPIAVNNFVALARDGWYNNITFHLVIPGQLVQTGDPSGSGFGGPGYTILDERDNGLTFDREGLVAMAATRGINNSAGSQFFITLAPLRPSQDYDKQFTIFGIVTSGMDVLKQLKARNPFDEQNFPNPPPGDKLIAVTIQEQAAAGP
jgi:cyclophilin family peptidyl-prolyl cis-trans isomerase/protein-disulfide isomerase